MTFNIITIFPKIFDSYFNESILKRAQKKGIIDIKIHNLRGWTTDKHQTVDDSPFGGGAGMVMKIEPLHKAVSSILYNVSKNKISQNTKYNPPAGGQNTKTILLSTKGKTWNQQKAKKYSKLDNIILICGRYEGVDERIKHFIDEEISIGDYVLTGGEIGALAIVDSITRLLPGALGNANSAKFESHSIPGVLEHPQYTRPEIFIPPLLKSPLPASPAGGLTKERARVRSRDKKTKQYRVPKILLSGNHKKIEEWRAKKMKRRP